jgi:cell fate regulator YaaT (PSP1 superfamily)
MTQPAAFVVRYGQMRLLGEFLGLSGQDHPRGQPVVVRTERGQELGEVLCPVSDRTAEFLEPAPPGEIERVATEEDELLSRSLLEQQRTGFRVCQELIERRRLQMDLVDVESILGGERLVFYYLAEKRVDFRELVKDLARAFRTRIEMRQIGVRDEAKLLADYGDCGKPVCCNTHLMRMPPVSMRMAKLQKSTLDPAKISGRCGRLKCCLRYEFETYLDYEHQLPPVGAWVTTSRGAGRVIAQEILARKVLIEIDERDQRRVLVGIDQVLAFEKPRRSAPGRDAPPQQHPDSDSDNPSR